MLRFLNTERLLASGFYRGSFATVVVFVATMTATGFAFALHSFFRPDLQAINTMIAFWISLFVTGPIVIYVRRINEALFVAREETEIARAAAEAANQAKTNFIANITHEIRTPMHGVLGLVDTLAATDLDARQKEYVDTISRAGNSLIAVVNDILDFSKLEAGMVVIDPAPFDLRRTAGDIATIFQRRAGEKRIELNFRASPDFPEAVVGDEVRLRQVLLNLTSNAVKFTEFGAVEIGLDGIVAGDACDVTVAISDTGVGVPADRLEAIFEKFVQADTSTNRRFGGTGLGLAICKELIEAMGGEIEVASEPGVGSTFSIRLRMPVAERPAAAGDGSAPALPAPDAQKRRLLVADDNEINRLVISAMIDEAFTVEFASTGVEAVELFATQAFDAILMDLSMPVMDGFAATRKIRAIERTDGLAPTPILCLTATDNEATRAEARAAGADDYLLKPFRRDQVVEAIDRCMRAVPASPPARAVNCA